MVQPLLDALAATLRSASDMSRACAPTCGVPMSPSTSLRGVRADTESTTMMSTEPLRTLGGRGGSGGRAGQGAGRGSGGRGELWRRQAACGAAVLDGVRVGARWGQMQALQVASIRPAPPMCYPPPPCKAPYAECGYLQSSVRTLRRAHCPRPARPHPQPAHPQSPPPPHQLVQYVEGHLPVVRLRHQQRAGVDAHLLGVGLVKRVLRVDEDRVAAALLDLRDRVQREGGLAAGLGAEDLGSGRVGWRVRWVRWVVEWRGWPRRRAQCRRP
jgi:hypothetical protein